MTAVTRSQLLFRRVTEVVHVISLERLIAHGFQLFLMPYLVSRVAQHKIYLLCQFVSGTRLVKRLRLAKVGVVYATNGVYRLTQHHHR